MQQLLHVCSTCYTHAGVQALDLSNTMIDDVDVIRVLKELPNLQLLNIAGCRKLTSTGLDVIEPTVGKYIHSLSVTGCCFSSVWL